MRIAIQGVRGSYSAEAARKICGEAAEILECADFPATFAAIAGGAAEYAVVPLENKIVGEIVPAAGLFRDSNLRIFDELALDIRHVLCGLPGAALDALEAVRSHPEALRQCRRFFAARAHLREIPGDDTAGSVRRVIADGDARCAAIASRAAAELYGARVLCEEVADDPHNWTKFFLVG